MEDRDVLVELGTLLSLLHHLLSHLISLLDRFGDDVVLGAKFPVAYI